MCNGKLWLKEEKEFLIDNYKFLSNKQLSEKLNKSNISVRRKKYVLGLKNRESIKQINNKNYKELTKEKAYILGVLCGDGWMYKNTFGLTCKDKDFIEYFINNVFEVYGLKSKLILRKPRLIKFPNNIILMSNEIYEIKFCSKLVCDDLKSYGKFNTKDWGIPKQIINSNDDIKYNFIKGIFDSEGSISNYKITFYSSNKNGLISVKDLLNSLSIKSSPTIYRYCGDNYSFSICRLNHLKNFIEKIGFSIERKQKKLIKEIKEKSSRILFRWCFNDLSFKKLVSHYEE